jgi:heat shock protein HslJ
LKILYRITPALLLPVLLLAGLTACASNQNRLAGPTWILESYNLNGVEQQAVPDSRATAVFDIERGQVSGSGGCNAYSAKLEVTGSEISLSDLISTKMACRPPLGTQETAFFNLLRTAQSYQVNGDTLTLTCESGQLVFSAAG